MSRSLRIQFILALLAAFLLVVPGTAVAQDAAPETKEKSEDASDEVEDESEEESDEIEEEEKDEEDRTTKHGSYEWQPSYGGGLEIGLWFNELDRWNANVLQSDVNDENVFDVFGLWHFDAAFEASFVEKTRLTLFGGIQTPFSSDPSAMAWYIGLEPAFAFRRDFWELAIGLGFGLGGTGLELDNGKDMDASLVLVRPFIEVRRYFGVNFAGFARFGFNQWLVDNPEFTDLEFTRANGEPISDDNLNEGGVFISLGFRFGHYPEHLKSVPDTDEDGIRDDVDDCPEDKEDFDEFEDDDGCPDLDNDKDGIEDKVDRCPMEAEDKDGWMDEDGCPETDDDSDGDGLLNNVDKCPTDAEDKDGFEDEDGCPELDNDGDSIPDAEDQCPNKPGVPQKKGCPFEKVEVTLDKVVIKDKVQFAYNKAEIKSDSFELLNEVAQTILAFPRIKKIEVGGHTDHKGSEKYNKDLSSRRAAAVMDYLIKQGVDASRLTSQGYGFDKPVVALPADGKETPEGAEANRRVEFQITEQEEVKKTVREDQVPDNAKVLDPNAKPEEAPKATPPAE